jgi:hypothetical protein
MGRAQAAAPSARARTATARGRALPSRALSSCDSFGTLNCSAVLLSCLAGSAKACAGTVEAETKKGRRPSTAHARHDAEGYGLGLKDDALQGFLTGTAATKTAFRAALFLNKRISEHASENRRTRSSCE